MIRAVLFDLDGTLLDRRQSLESFIGDQYNRYAAHFTEIEKMSIVLALSSLIITATLGKIKSMLSCSKNITLRL